MAVDLVRSAKRSYEAGNYENAWRQITVALNDQWENPQALYVAGLILRERGDIATAAHLFRRALAIEKHQVNLWMNYGACLHDMHMYDDARKVFELVHQQIPQDSQPLANMASGYIQQGKLNDAIKTAKQALERNPDNIIGKIAMGYGSLGLGRWKEAWSYLDVLYGEHVATRVYNSKDNEEPEWDGEKGKTVVVTCDQGVGDIIMFAQCLPEMVRGCKQVIVECAPRMESMFKRCFPGIHVYGTLGKFNMSWVSDYKIDARINMSFLGRFYRNSDKDFPRKAYLTADQKMQEAWLEKLSHHPRPWIGLAWEGGLVSTMKRNRSFPLEDLAPVLEGGGSFIDMNYRDCREEVALWNIAHKEQVFHPYIDTINFDQTIALVSVLDEVITATTTLAHVCGALGRTASVLVPSIAQWRYQYRFGDGMIWYPEDSVKLYRQKPGEADFKPAIERLAKDRVALRRAA